MGRKDLLCSNIDSSILFSEYLCNSGFMHVDVTDWLVPTLGKVVRSMNITIGILDLLRFQTNYLKPNPD